MSTNSLHLHGHENVPRRTAKLVLSTGLKFREPRGGRYQ